MENCTIFLVEDDPWYGEILEYHLSLNPDNKVYRFRSGQECLDHLYKNPSLITIDYYLPDMSGEELFQRIRTTNPQVPVIAISSQENVSTAVSMLKLGVQDYLIKDDNTKDLLWNALLRIRENQQGNKAAELLPANREVLPDFSKSIKGNSPVLKNIFHLMAKAAKTNISISISGETGTGKELVAKAIHDHSERKSKPFVAVNMAAIPRELLESELFGHEKGSFTGAVGRKTGKFEEANKGTLFLDEIAELDLSLQAKLLRVLQERELTRIGGNEKVKLDVRIIVATHKNLAQEVKNGRFREDLYYRIMGLPIELPSLRERGRDVILLANYFLDEFCRENKLGLIQLSEEAREKLLTYNFPGNVRELKAVMDMAAVICDGKVISASDIGLNNATDEIHFWQEEKTLKEYTINIIQHFLQKYDNNVLKVAHKLDVGKSTIYKMIQSRELVLNNGVMR